MSSRVLFIAALITATVSAASGQTGTADGVAALARGDYQRAVEILRPIAEDWGSNDAAAQFFMAGLYETGRGVSADPLRACALYLRASQKQDHPFGHEASLLFGALTLRGGREFDRECVLLSNIGFDHGFEPATFHLGPGHSVEWTLAAATVTYQGRTRRQEMGLEISGARFLPLRYTELATGPTRSVTRHFVEVFVWQPTTKSGGWSLQSLVFEVVEDQIVTIDTTGPIATAEGELPPSRESFDVREYVVLRVDDKGNAEWAVLKGPRPGTQRIETEAERREVRDESAARAAALKRVDWNQRYDVYRQPAMTYIDAEGCGRIQVFGWTADRAEAVVVRVARELGVSSPATFDLSRESATVSVATHVYEIPQHQFQFCSDVMYVPSPGSIGPQIWRAVAGTMTIALSPPGIRARAPDSRRATIALTDVVLQNEAGTTVKVARPARLTTIVRASW